MIITRSPLRVSLGGGGTDLPSYYRDHGGFLVAAAVDKYVYITQHRTFQEEIIVKYSKLERVLTVDEIEHPIVRDESLESFFVMSGKPIYGETTITGSNTTQFILVYKRFLCYGINCRKVVFHVLSAIVTTDLFEPFFTETG